MNYNKGKQEYILARLLVIKKYIKDNNLSDALDCLDDIYHDIETDYDSEIS